LGRETGSGKRSQKEGMGGLPKAPTIVHQNGFDKPEKSRPADKVGGLLPIICEQGSFGHTFERGKREGAALRHVRKAGDDARRHRKNIWRAKKGSN